MVIRKSFSKRFTRAQRSYGPKDCFFCQKDKEPDYWKIEVLKNFISDRAKILRSEKTGLCQKHQRRATKSIKQARYLALLPFAARVTR